MTNHIYPSSVEHLIDLSQQSSDTDRDIKRHRIHYMMSISHHMMSHSHHKMPNSHLMMFHSHLIMSHSHHKMSNSHLMMSHSHLMVYKAITCLTLRVIP